MLLYRLSDLANSIILFAPLLQGFVSAATLDIEAPFACEADPYPYPRTSIRALDTFSLFSWQIRVLKRHHLQIDLCKMSCTSHL